ncbi:MAG: Hsp70 family protein, partial [Cyanobacteriota bacterium]
IQGLLEEAERKAAEDRRRRADVDRRNKAQTLVAQAERRLRDAALELGPYGAERQQRSVEMALRDVQDLLAGDDVAGLELSVSQLQEALFGLNRRLLSERRAEAGPLQGLKNTLGSLKDELFAEDDWDDWERDRARSGDPWSTPSRYGSGGNSWEEERWRPREPMASRPRDEDWSRNDSWSRQDGAARRSNGPLSDERDFDDEPRYRSRRDNDLEPSRSRVSRPSLPDDDPWAT